MHIRGVDHIAISGRDFSRSRAFYVGVLGLEVVSEYLQARGTWKADLRAPDGVLIELFGFQDAPSRVTGPEALGLRHIAFSVQDPAGTRAELLERGVPCEDLRVDPGTGCTFFFARDPDGLPIEFYARHG